MKEYLKIIEVKPQLSFLLFVILTADFLIFISGNLILGIIMALISISLIFKSSGFIIDKEKNRVKKISGFWGLKLGTWQTLPEINYVSLLRVKQSKKAFQASSASFVQESSNNCVYKLNLIVAEGYKQKTFNLISDSHNVVIEKGLIVGEYLGIKVLDITTPNKKWIK